MSQTQNIELSTDDFSPVRTRSSRAKEKEKVNEDATTANERNDRSDQKLARKLTMKIYQILTKRYKIKGIDKKNRRQKERYVYRFINNAPSPKNKRVSGPLRVRELVSATEALVKRAQLESFKNDVQMLQVKKTIPSSSRLLSLSPRRT